MASTAPNAQHDPQLPWSRISRMVGQFGQFKRASNSVGKSFFSVPNSLAGCWKRFELSCTPIRLRKKDAGIDEWKFEPACRWLKCSFLVKKKERKEENNAIPKCTISYTRHVDAFLLISSMNSCDNGLTVSSVSSDNAKVIKEKTNKILE